jgi:hypothetical protein
MAMPACSWCGVTFTTWTALHAHQQGCYRSTSTGPVATGIGPNIGGASGGAWSSSSYSYAMNMTKAMALKADDKYDPDRAPDGIEPLIAWRSWTVHEITGDLLSANRHVFWHRGPQRAHCLPPHLPPHGGGHSHPAPQSQCDCGYYGYHAPSGIAATGEILGAIKLWGEVLTNPQGIVRGEWVEIVVLVSTDAAQRSLVSERYPNVPIVGDLEAAKKIAYQHGRECPESLKAQAEPPRPDPSPGSSATARYAHNPRVHLGIRTASPDDLTQEMGRFAEQMERAFFSWRSLAPWLCLSLLGAALSAWLTYMH